ncbi:MAG: RdgB/HAM1 family non-canonical purine NTP pyrophosphatase [Polyangiaceae bacterium]
MKLVLATLNRGKIKELRELLMDLDIEVLSIADASTTKFVVVEDGVTFAENASKKSRAAAELTRLLSLADDSGLEVDALGGAPGVWSARFAGEHATDEENNAALVDALKSKTDLRARYRCALSLFDPATNRESIVEATCEGRITLTPRGVGGFGYDPYFIVDGCERTMAELNADEKNSLSHRAKALAQIQPKIAGIIESARAGSGT